MKRIRAEKVVENTVLRQIDYVDKLEEHIQYDLAAAMVKEAFDNNLLRIEKTDMEWSYDASKYQLEVYVMTPYEFKKVTSILQALKNFPISYGITSMIWKLENIILDRK